MAEQGNNGGDFISHGMSQQAQSYSIGSMDIMDEMTVGGIGNSPEEISQLDRSVDSLGPFFPPQNFEVPDISFSNSVSPNADFKQSLLSSAQVYGNSSNIFTSAGGSAGHLVEGQQVGLHKHQMGVGGQRQMPYFPPASQSPPGTSSSDDSDDLPLAQLAKRVVTSGASTTNAASNASAPSPSAHSTDTTSMEGSPISNVAPKKAKQPKKKKKKDPNEPQKPVSAYALFFRDTQATIKGHNPSASFGEVSKIVASMWDQLDPEHKDVYKKKTDLAKKQYLKQLAAYRASQVSQSAADEAAEKSPSPPGVTNLTGPARFQATGGPGGQMMTQQKSHVQQQSPPHSAQISAPVMQHHQQLQLQQQQQQQQQQLHQQMVMTQRAQPSPPRQQYSPPQEMIPMAGATYKSTPQSQAGNAIYQHTLMDHNSFGFSDLENKMEVTAPLCVRSGCRNHAKENPAWDSEYCSNDCVITHCRDIFKTWVASRSGLNSYPVK